MKQHTERAKHQKRVQHYTAATAAQPGQLWLLYDLSRKETDPHVRDWYTREFERELKNRNRLPTPVTRAQTGTKRSRSAPGRN